MKCAVVVNVSPCAFLNWAYWSGVCVQRDGVLPTWRIIWLPLEAPMELGTMLAFPRSGRVLLSGGPEVMPCCALVSWRRVSRVELSAGKWNMEGQPSGGQ